MAFTKIVSPGIDTTGSYTVRDLNAVGVLTASAFSGPLTGNATGTAGGLSGSPSITVADITASGNVSIAGTLTYEDVTNIDSVGIITAQSDVSIADKIIHTADTDTAIRFPAADTFSVETAGSERLRISADGTSTFTSTVDIGGDANNGTAEGLQLNANGFIQASRGSGVSALWAGYTQGSSTQTSRIDNDGDAYFLGKIGIGTNNPTTNLQVNAASNEATISLFNGGTKKAALQTQNSFGTILYSYDNEPLIFSVASGTSYSEKLRIASNGNITIGTASNPGGKLFFESSSGSAQCIRSGGTNNQNLLFGTASTEYLRITSNGDLFVAGTGGSGDTTQLPNGSTININGNSSNDGFSIIRYSSGYGAYGLNIGRSKSGTVGTNAIVSNNNDIGHITFYGADGSTYLKASMITAQVDGTPSAGSGMPGRLVFKTSPDGSATPVERLRISSDGNVSITNNPATNASKLFIRANSGANAGKWSDSCIALYNTTGASEYSQMGLGYTLGTWAPSYMGYINTSTSSYGMGALVFGTRNVVTDSQPTERLRIQPSGYVGIGEDAPGGKLTVKHANTATSGLNATLKLKQGSATNGNRSSLLFSSLDDFDVAAVNGTILTHSGSASNNEGRLEFWTKNIGSAIAERVRIQPTGFVQIGSGYLNATSYHRINGINQTQGNALLVVSGYQPSGGSNQDTAVFFSVNNSGSPNASGTALKVFRDSVSSRSINAAGTLNASGNDYAEYMTKAGDFTLAKGDICGINSEGKLTNVFADAISFVVKSTDPSYVGGDAWHEVAGEEPGGYDDTRTEEEIAAAKVVYEEALESARQLVDRIAFSGQVPVNMTGATPGQYIIPTAASDGSIEGTAKAEADLTISEYISSVGKVIAVEDDGRARIIVKVS